MSPVAAEDPEAQSLAPRARVVAHKFGGTSVADAERYRHVAALLLARDDEVQVTVVSAMKGVTDVTLSYSFYPAQTSAPAPAKPKGAGQG